MPEHKANNADINYRTITAQDDAALAAIIRDNLKARGLGYEMIARIEQEAEIRGYSRMYLETHDNLDVAIHLYQRCGYTEIDKPEGVVHSSMNRFFIKML